MHYPDHFLATLRLKKDKGETLPHGEYELDSLRPFFEGRNEVYHSKHDKSLLYYIQFARLDTALTNRGSVLGVHTNFKRSLREDLQPSPIREGNPALVDYLRHSFLAEIFFVTTGRVERGWALIQTYRIEPDGDGVKPDMRMDDVAGWPEQPKAFDMLYYQKNEEYQRKRMTGDPCVDYTFAHAWNEKLCTLQILSLVPVEEFL